MDVTVADRGLTAAYPAMPVCAEKSSGRGTAVTRRRRLRHILGQTAAAAAGR